MPRFNVDEFGELVNDLHELFDEYDLCVNEIEFSEKSERQVIYFLSPDIQIIRHCSGSNGEGNSFYVVVSLREGWESVEEGELNQAVEKAFQEDILPKSLKEKSRKVSVDQNSS